MKCKSIAVILALALSCSPAVADTSVTLLDTNKGNYSITNATPAYYIHNFVSDDLREAFPFAFTGSAYQLQFIDLHVAARNSSTERLRVSLMSDAGNAPGTALDEYIMINLPVRPDGGDSSTINFPQQLITADHPTLLPDTRYWIALSAPDVSLQSDVYWFVSPLNLNGELATLSSPLNGTAWSTSQSQPLPGITVVGTPIPEPGIGVMCLPSLVALFRRKPIKRSTLYRRAVGENRIVIALPLPASAVAAIVKTGRREYRFRTNHRT